jgi:Calcineurin-like phosphoesterase
MMAKRRHGGGIAALLGVAAILASGSSCTPTKPAAAQPSTPDPKIELPLEEGSLRLAVIGDSGTGDREQYQVADTMVRFHEKFPFDAVLMLGDNLYGSEDPEDYEEKFELPYKKLLDEGVKFYASLGNHDEASQRHYKNFNMGGREYYTFTRGDDVRFFAINSSYFDAEQLEWLREELSKSKERWKICFFHHPIYSSGGRHGPDLPLREQLEPLFVQHGVDAVFAGHEHFYERIKPQNGIVYFISGGAGKLRKGNIRTSDITATGFDRDRHFMLVEIAGGQLHFQTISRTGLTVDSGVVPDRDIQATESSREAK